MLLDLLHAWRVTSFQLENLCNVRCAGLCHVESFEVVESLLTGLLLTNQADLRAWVLHAGRVAGNPIQGPIRSSTMNGTADTGQAFASKSFCARSTSRIRAW